MTNKRTVVVVFAILCSLAAAPAGASPNTEQGASQGPQLHEGRRHVEGRVGHAGATFELAGRFKLVIPPGLPIGASTMKLSVIKRRPSPRQVGHGFLPLGPTLRFSGAINASENPLQLSMRAKRLPRKYRYRYAVAVEHADICTEENKRHRLPNGLCQSWKLHEAKRTPKGLRAEVPVTGGRRVQFGMVPIEALAD